MGTFLFFHAFNFSNFLRLRLKVDKHSIQWFKIMLIWRILLLQQAKHWCWVLAKKACFCKLQLFRFFQLFLAWVTWCFFSVIVIRRAPCETPYQGLCCYHGNKRPRHHCVCLHSWQLVWWCWYCLIKFDFQVKRSSWLLSHLKGVTVKCVFTDEKMTVWSAFPINNNNKFICPKYYKEIIPIYKQ